ncbi:hypothetical protein [Mesorhizobium sp.]|uniref:hypothetical protein n=1 Tax=Mesorhizobium sp. TaxID=1871066 RepID=UPI000FE7E940|nr:hypothetical protein [Mesorhizobium sp.]RWP02651.1 MAG: hypothetical protein EOQ99_22335 [Mesorhizobium sp.]
MANLILRPDGDDEALHGGIGAFTTAFANLAPQANGGEIGIGGDAFTQTVDKGAILLSERRASSVVNAGRKMIRYQSRR